MKIVSRPRALRGDQDRKKSIKIDRLDSAQNHRVVVAQASSAHEFPVFRETLLECARMPLEQKGGDPIEFILSLSGD